MERQNPRGLRDSSLSTGFTRRKGRTFWLVGGVGAAIVAIAVVAFLILPMLQSGAIGPSNFAPAYGPVKVAPGSVGCPAVSGLVCYLTAVATRLHGLTLSNLEFRVMNLSRGNGTVGALGPNATVSVPGPSGTVVGLWWFSNQTWSSGSSWQVEFNTNVSFVLNTGLLSYSSLSGAWFAVELTSPFGGEVNFPLTGPGTENPS